MERNSVVKAQHRKAYLVEWREEECFVESGITEDSLKFWQGVAKQNNLKDLATCALACLITPASNAIVERIFF